MAKKWVPENRAGFWGGPRRSVKSDLFVQKSECPPSEKNFEEKSNPAQFRSKIMFLGVSAHFRTGRSGASRTTDSGFLAVLLRKTGFWALFGRSGPPPRGQKMVKNRFFPKSQTSKFSAEFGRPGSFLTTFRPSSR